MGRNTPRYGTTADFITALKNGNVPDLDPAEAASLAEAFQPLADFQAAIRGGQIPGLRPAEATGGPRPLTLDFHDLCLACNLAAIASRFLFGKGGHCIAAAAALCGVARYFKYEASLLRVEALVMSDSGSDYAELGSLEARTSAGPGYWAGHLVTIVAGRYLLDPCLGGALNEQHPRVGATPTTLEVPPSFARGEAFAQSDWVATGELGTKVRYTVHPRQVGWKSKQAYRQCNVVPVVTIIIGSLDELGYRPARLSLVG